MESAVVVVVVVVVVVAHAAGRIAVDDAHPATRGGALDGRGKADETLRHPIGRRHSCQLRSLGRHREWRKATCAAPICDDDGQQDQSHADDAMAAMWTENHHHPPRCRVTDQAAS